MNFEREERCISARPCLSQSIMATAAGDARAFSVLYLQTSRALFGVCFRILRSRADAEDALQDIYLKIWLQSGSFRVTSELPMSWLKAIARNQALDKLRAKRRRERGLVSDPTGDLRDDVAPDPEDLAIQMAEWRRLLSGLAALPPRQAEAVVRAALTEESNKELALRFNVPLNTIKTWLHRSRRELKERQGDSEDRWGSRNRC